MLMVIMPAPRTDSLYHYNAAQNRLEARFTVEYPNKEKIPGTAIPNTRVTLSETFPCRYKYQKTLGAAASLPKYIIDKKTLHGSYFPPIQ